MNITFKILCLILIHAAGTTATNKHGCESDVEELKQELGEQKAAIVKMSELMETMSSNIMANVDIRLEEHYKDLMQHIENIQINSTVYDFKQASNGSYLAHGCEGENVQLSCPENRTIFITHSDYGQYGTSYTQPNCAPHPYNRIESVSETDEDQWIYMKYLCDNQTTCSYDFGGSYFVTDCAPGSQVDYVSIYYDCLPEPTVEAVGFTADAPNGKTYYNTDDIVIFNSTASNIGGYYHPGSSIFLCPAEGMYAFFLSILTSSQERFYASIMKESERLDSVFGETGDIEYFNNGVSNFIVTMCSKGERVWVRCLEVENAMYENYNRYNTFSGILLNRF